MNSVHFGRRERLLIYIIVLGLTVCDFSLDLTALAKVPSAFCVLLFACKRIMNQSRYLIVILYRAHNQDLSRPVESLLPLVRELGGRVTKTSKKYAQAAGTTSTLGHVMVDLPVPVNFPGKKRTAKGKGK
jgi:hypothetical protein